jgi:uncharacterized membrane protein YbhN (UPF0104 family)
MISAERRKSIVKNVLKLAITVVAMYYVFQKIDFDEFLSNIRQAQIGYLLIALVLFNISKIASAFRSLKFYYALQIYLSNTLNLMLYYIGMFYNLFLPGAIGGDGYKVYLLKQSNKNVKTKQLVGAAVLDRLSGMAVIFFLACIFFLMSSAETGLLYVQVLVIIAAFLVFPGFFLFVRLIFPVFQSVFFSTTVYSFIVQGSQVICAYFILRSLGINDFFVDYFTLFLISSVVSILPFTVGGVGARELVFLYGYQFLSIDEDKAIAFTILFFIITAVTSLSGLFISFRLDSSKLKSVDGA